MGLKDDRWFEGKRRGGFGRLQKFLRKKKKRGRMTEVEKLRQQLEKAQAASAKKVVYIYIFSSLSLFSLTPLERTR